MDKITISKLEVYAHHGVFEAEKKAGQTFFVSADLYMDLKAAGSSDDLSKTVSYADVCHDVKRLMTEKSYDLIETCADVIARNVLQSYPAIQKAEIIIFKPDAPIGLPLTYVAVTIARSRSIAYLGLGANLETPEKMLDTAIERLKHPQLKVLQSSSYVQTKPISDIPQDDYVNCAVKIETTFTPEELLMHTQKIESDMGRVRKERFGARLIDIDILLYDDLILNTKNLILPHPRMHERLFVLVPLSEIDPYALHPLCKHRMVDIKTKLEETQTL